MEVTNFMVDLKIAIKHLWSLPLVFGKIPPLFNKNSELNIQSYNKISDALISAKSAFIGSTLDKVNTNPTTESLEVFFLNGICTDKNVWEINVKEIESIFDFTISPLYNATNGLIPDLIECIFGRTFNLTDKETYHLYKTLLHSIKTKEKVIVLAHSQGGIIIAQLVEHLINNNVDLSNLEIYTFASASDEMLIGNYHVEHYANNYDFVARIGVLQYRDNFYGKIYKRKGSGHLLNIHYLKPFACGEFCIGKSKLASYLKYKHKTFININE